MNIFFDWAFTNKLELSGTVFGLIYVWLSIRQSLLTWFAGIITSILYIGVFLEAKLYAEMVLQFYYVIMSVFGWWSWKHGGKSDAGSLQLGISNTSLPVWVRLFMINFILTLVMYSLLRSYTDSPNPFLDGLITSLSFIATWMLARKKLEHWIIWIFVDIVCAALYLYRGLYPSVFLFLVYTVMAGIGFHEWRKEAAKLT